MLLNALASEQISVRGVIDPDANTAATYTTAWVDMAGVEEILAIVMSGDLGSSATIAAKLEQATSSAGAGAKDITSKAMTGYTQTPGDDSNKQTLINCRREDLDIDNNFRYARLSMTVAVATSDSGAIVLGIGSRRHPASDGNLTTVDETIA